jgi:YegS/Rv2252/BmrU family lipid kinase
MFSDADYTCQVQTTSIMNSAESIVMEYGKPCDLIICAGGDGTFNEVVSGCLKCNIRPKIGYIPAGSTNDFANGMKMSLNPLEAARRILDGNVIDIDAGLFDNRVFTYIASFGIFTKASYNTPRDLKNSLGYFAYVMEGVKELADVKSYHLRITSKEKCIEGNFVFGGICNSKRIGGGVVKFDDNIVDMNDGKFEIFLVKFPKTMGELFQAIFDVNVGNFDSPMIEFFSSDSITIETHDDIDWTIDGEYQKGSYLMEAKNIQSAIPLVM